uniref:Uncharacterized protein n=1 Tax=Hemiselmis tepida TaxID=464990 RepID=A0A7S0VBT5_9CRYP
MFQLLIVSHSGGSWTRNLLPDWWKNGSGGNSQYTGPGTSGDLWDSPTESIPLARVANPYSPTGGGNYMQGSEAYAKGYRRGPGGIHVDSRLPCPATGGIC